MAATTSDKSKSFLDLSGVGVLNSLTAHIAVLDLQGNIISINEAWRKFAEKNGCNLFRTDVRINYLDVYFKAPYESTREDAIKAVNGIQMVLDRKKNKFEMEYPCRAPDKEIWFLIRVTAIDIKDARAVISHTDITKRKYAEKKLYQNLHFTQTLLKAIPIPIFYKDQQGRYLGCNPAFSQITGVSQQTLKGKTVRDLWPGEQAELFHKKDLELIKNKQHQVYETTLKDENGNIRSCIFSKDVFYNEHGFVKGIIGAITDLTEKKHQEAEFSKFAAVIEQAAEEVVITDTDAVIQYVNPTFEKNTGFSRMEVLGKNPRILKSGFHDHLFYKNLWRTILDKKTWKGKIINQRKDGRQLIHDTLITPIIDKGGEITAFVSVRRDITEQEKIEKQLQQAYKMEAIGTLAGGIAHDFNNIRSNQEDWHPVNVKLLIKEVTKLLRASLPSTIEITLSLMSDSYVMADPTNIHQILMNICTNAKDAMEKTSGLLSISTADVILGETDLADHENSRPGKFLLISIADTGMGMTDDIIKKAMEPFFTTKAKEQGTGMGLFVVHGIVKNLGGFISITSEIKTGSKFDIYLPVCHKSPDDPDMPGEKEVPGGNESILFVDDEMVLGEIVKDSLSCFGYHVTSFTDSMDALHSFEKNRDQYDLVISDITMPGITGDVLIQKIRFIKPDVPVILCTGAKNLIDEQTAKKIKIDALLFKPIRIKKMALTVRNILDGKTAWEKF